MAASPATHAVEVRDLCYAFGARSALDRVAIEFDGGVAGVVGPNGAGKSTLLAVLATALPTRPGTVFVQGNDLGTRSGRTAARACLGWLPQRFDLAAGMRVHETVAYAAWANGRHPREVTKLADASLEVVGLRALAEARVRTISGGQRQRLGLACAIAHEPELLLLDEPTAGLDPEQRMRFRAAMTRAGRGRTVVLSSHLLDDVAGVCDRVVVLSGGRRRFIGTPRELAALGGDRVGRGLSALEAGYLHALGNPADDEP